MSDTTGQLLLLGNEAIGRALVAAGASVVTAYPGTPSSEILAAAAALARKTGAAMHAEWSVNEKVAYETALAAAMAGKRAAVAMKQVGLNVAADPFMRSAYLGVTGGFVVIVADDPGPHSSQTEQDSRLFALLAQVPVFDPSSPREAAEMVAAAFELSERHGIPVMLRPTTRVCHGRQNVFSPATAGATRPADFRRDPRRWCATPGAVRELHLELNARLARIAAEEALAPRLELAGDGSLPETAVIASGVAAAHARELLESGIFPARPDLWVVPLPHPLHASFISLAGERYRRLLVLEETAPVIELQLADRSIRGRVDETVPGAGELTPEVVRGVLETFLGVEPTVVEEAPAGGVRPTLCAGCGHRAAFYALKEAFPTGIFPGDIGCYTLGVNLGAVDTCHCMGAGISQAAGFYQAYRLDGGTIPPLAATIGDSTFFHAGVPALVNAVVQRAAIVVLILDNDTTAMTGHQPTPQAGTDVHGRPAPVVAIEGLARAAGAVSLAVADPYDVPGFVELLRQAHLEARERGGPAVVIARHPCVLTKEGRQAQTAVRVLIDDRCTGCRRCITRFECPAIVWDAAAKRAAIDRERCIDCGVCVHACPVGAIVAGERP